MPVAPIYNEEFTLASKKIGAAEEKDSSPPLKMQRACQPVKDYFS